MREARAARWAEKHAYDLLAAAFLIVCLILVLANISIYPVYLDIPYHMAVTRGFQEAGGVVTWDFWDYAPQGRPHIYPPLVHVGMSLMLDTGMSMRFAATLVCMAMFPLILLAVWWAMRGLFGPRAGFYALALTAVSYAFFWQTGITIAASLVLALTPLVFLALERERRVAAGVLLALCLYSHLVLGHLAALALLVYLVHRREKWKAILFTLVLAYLLYLPWGINVLVHLGSFSASEPGAGGGFALHLLLWGLAAAGCVACYLRRGRHYLLPAYLLSMVPIAFFYPNRFWEGHIFVPLAMLGGVALDRLHAFLSERLARRPSRASYAGALAAGVLAVLLALTLFVDPVLASRRAGPASTPGGGNVSGPVPPEGDTPRYPQGRMNAPPAGDMRPPLDVPLEPGGAGSGAVPGAGVGPGGGRRPLAWQLLERERKEDLGLSLDPTTLSVLLGWEEWNRGRAGEGEVFGAENQALMEALLEYGEEGDVVFTPEGRLGDLIYAMTGLYATSGMFHEVQPEATSDPLAEADLAVVPIGAAAAAGAAGASGARGGLAAVLRDGDWSLAERVGSYMILVREEAEGGTRAYPSSLPLWAAYLLLAAAVAAMAVDAARGRGGRGTGDPGTPGDGPAPPGKNGPGGGPAPRPECGFPPGETQAPPPGVGGDAGPVLAVVLAHNEEGSVGAVVEEIRRSCPGMDVLVVDDGSSDATAAVAARAGAVVMRLEENLGVGEAEKRGLAYAQARGYGCAVRLDGDGQHPAAYIPRLLVPLRRGEADVVVGSRFLPGGGGSCRASRPRRLGMAVFRFLLRRVTGWRFSDPTSGFRAYSAAAMAAMSRGEPQRYPEVVSLRDLSLAGYRVREVPVEMAPRRHGRSSLAGLRGMAAALAVARELLHARSPGTRPDVRERCVAVGTRA